MSCSCVFGLMTQHTQVVKMCSLIMCRVMGVAPIKMAVANLA